MGEIISGSAEFKRIPSGKRIRLYAFAAAAMIVGIGFFISAAIQAGQTERMSRAAYTRAASDFAERLRVASESIEKLRYVSEREQAAELLARIYSELALAGSAASQLPMPVVNTDAGKMHKFISESGEYAFELLKKLLRGGEVEESDFMVIEKMGEYADKLTMQLVVLEDGINREPWEKKAFDRLLAEADGIFSGYGGLNAAVHSRSAGVRDSTEEIIDSAAARERAGEFLGVAAKKIKPLGESNSTPAFFSYEYKNKHVRVAKKGGAIIGLLTDRGVSEEKYFTEEALAAAVKYASEAGYDGVFPTYYTVEGGVLTARLSPEVNQVTIYTEVVYVGVAMDNLELMSLGGDTYIKNHKSERVFPAEIISQSEAKSTLTREAEIINYNLALVEGSGSGEEKLCYEFLMRNSAGREFLIYVNAQTGAQEELRLLIDTGNGKIVR